MTKHMRDDEFEALLGRALTIEAAPAHLVELIDAPAARGRFWLTAFLSPARMAASAAILSLLMGFAMGWGNANLSDGQDLDVASVLYAANDVGEF
ncbi:MAG: hypothetical protein HYU58_18745 [Proteobacteria bacterium]|nr:hypothetical protein [Pseudomonadota bacterium]